MPFDLIEAARHLIATDTVSSRGNVGIHAPLTAYAAQAGLETLLFPDRAAGVDQANILFRRPRPPTREAGEAADALLLLTHTDTVPPGPLDRWTVTPPLTAKIEGDRLYGLGSADVKVDLLCKLLALERLHGVKLRREVFILGTFGEEIGLLGAKSFVRNGPFRPRFVVCGEPSELTIIHAHKGYLVARVNLGKSAASQPPIRKETFGGKSAHSSTPHLGENAILKALQQSTRAAVAIRGGQGANSVPAECTVEFSDGPETLPLADARRLAGRFAELVSALSPAVDDRFTPPHAVSNLGFIDGRDGRVEMLLDARLLPRHRPEALADAFEEEVRSVGGTVSFERDNPAVYTNPQSPLCRAAQSVSRGLGLDAALHTKATNTEAAAFAGKADAIVFGPGPSVGNAHCPNEHTFISQLRIAIDWYERLIRELCA